MITVVFWYLERLKRKLFKRLNMEDLDLRCLITKLSDKNELVFIHGRRVARLACAITEAMKYFDVEIEIIFQAAVVHDIGKIQLPTEIVNKPGPLDNSEFTIIKKHPELGYYLLRNLKSETIVAQVALQHHERLDGSGYPFGLRGGKIILPSRIIAVADVIDTIVSAQVYRPASTMGKARQEIKQNSGLLYDPEVVAASLLLIKKGEFSV